MSRIVDSKRHGENPERSIQAPSSFHHSEKEHHTCAIVGLARHVATTRHAHTHTHINRDTHTKKKTKAARRTQDKHETISKKTSHPQSHARVAHSPETKQSQTRPKETHPHTCLSIQARIKNACMHVSECVSKYRFRHVCKKTPLSSDAYHAHTHTHERHTTSHGSNRQQRSRVPVVTASRQHPAPLAETKKAKMHPR